MRVEAVKSFVNFLHSFAQISSRAAPEGVHSDFTKRKKGWTEVQPYVERLNRRTYRGLL
jgi:hypothetical protein